MIVGADLTVEVMKLLQAKEPLNLTLGESVNRIMDLLIGNQHRIKKILQLNENSSEAFFLLGKTFMYWVVDLTIRYHGELFRKWQDVGDKVEDQDRDQDID